MKAMYIHLPFCKTICTYCDFCKQLYNETNVKKYLKALREEIQDRYNDEELETLYIGGGTPSSLNISELNELFDILKLLKLNNIKEFTFECNVNDITEEMIKLLKQNKVNRISIGVESFDKEKLKFMERYADFDDVLKKVNLIREIGINNINIDLMYGIPGETLKTLKKDIDLILKLKPTHISTYSLILEESTKLSLQNIKPIDEELITALSKDHKLIVTIEENVLKGGYGMNVLQFVNDNELPVKVYPAAFDDEFIEHGDSGSLRKKHGLGEDDILDEIKRRLNR